METEAEDIFADILFTERYSSFVAWQQKAIFYVKEKIVARKFTYLLISLVIWMIPNFCKLNLPRFFYLENHFFRESSCSSFPVSSLL